MPCDMMSGATSGDFLWPRVQELQVEGDKVTRMLCTILRALEAKGELPDEPELREWFEKHKEYDQSQGR